MTEDQIALAQKCLSAAENESMNFPDIVGTLIDAGFESYAIDYRRATATYYLPDGDSVVLDAHRVDSEVASQFDAAALQAAIWEAQTQALGYSYAGFCRKASAAGTAGYIVSFLGRRAVYFGRTGECHVEHFPGN
jgi:uncharacterized protein YbcV (DUF1398 family)